MVKKLLFIFILLNIINVAFAINMSNKLILNLPFNATLNDYSVKNITLVYNGTNANYCYQETANISTCLNPTLGNYTYIDLISNPKNSYDGDYITYSTATGIPGSWVINYATPSWVNRIGTKWQVKDNLNFINISLPEQCIVNTYHNTTLLIELWSAMEEIKYYCWSESGGAWITLLDSIGSNKLYEEAVYWANSSVIYTQDKLNNLNNAIYLNGYNEQLNTTLNISSRNQTNMSMSAWVKLSDTGDDQDILSSSRPVGGNLLGQVLGTICTVEWYEIIDTSQIPIALIAQSSPNNICDNSWHNLVSTMDSNNIKLYLDNILVSSTARNGYVVNDTAYYWIGNDPYYKNHYTNGSIDNVLVYNRTLNPYEVSYIYDNYDINDPEMAMTTIYANNLSNIPINFNITILNLTSGEVLDTTTAYNNATIYVPMLGVSIIVNTAEYGNIYNITSVNRNVSSAYNLSFYKAVLYVNVNSRTSGIIPTASIRVNSSTYENVTISGQMMYALNNNTYSILANATNYVDTSQVNITLPYGSNTTIDLNLTPTFTIRILREQDWSPFNFSESNISNYTMYIDVLCDTSSQRIYLTEYNQTLSNITCDYNYWYITLLASTTSYFRTGIPSEGTNFTNIYMLDLKSDNILETIFMLNDLSGEFSGGYLLANKFINGSKVTVIKQKWGMEKKATLWLDESEEYELVAEDISGAQSTLGNYIATSAGTKYISLPSIPFHWDTNYEGVGIDYNADKEAGTADLIYHDYTPLGFYKLNWTIYRGNTTNQVFSFQQIYGHNVTTTAMNLNKTDTYTFTLTIDHRDNNFDKTVNRVLWYGNIGIFDGFEDIDDDIKLWIAIGVPTLIIMVGSVGSVIWVYGIGLVLTGIFHGMGWYKLIDRPVMGLSFMTVLITVFAVFGVLMWFKERGKE